MGGILESNSFVGSSFMLERGRVPGSFFFSSYRIWICLVFFLQSSYILNTVSIKFPSLVRPAAMETRTQQAQSRLDSHEEHIQKLQSDVTAIKASLQSLEADQSSQSEFLLFMMNWIKQQEKQPASERGERSGAFDGPSPPPINRSSGFTDQTQPPSPSVDTLPWVAKKIKLPKFSGFDPQGSISKAELYFDICNTWNSL